MSDKTIMITVILSLIIILIVIIVTLRKRRYNLLKEHIEQLDREKNMIETAPIPSELAKLETIIKNDKIEEKYNNWLERFESIKTDNIDKINDMLIDLDFVGGKRKYSEYILKIAQAEIEIAKAKRLTDTLLDEIKEITLSEEKYRSIIIKLKTRYRELFNAFDAHKSEYADIEHGSSDWCAPGEQYRILSKKSGIILAKDNYLPIDKTGNVNVLIVGRIWCW